MKLKEGAQTVNVGQHCEMFKTGNSAITSTLLISFCSSESVCVDSHIAYLTEGPLLLEIWEQISDSLAHLRMFFGVLLELRKPNSGREPLKAHCALHRVFVLLELLSVLGGCCLASGSISLLLPGTTFICSAHVSRRHG